MYEMLTLALYLSCKTMMLSIVRPCKGSVMYACLSGKKRRGQKKQKKTEMRTQTIKSTRKAKTVVVSTL